MKPSSRPLAFALAALGAAAGCNGAAASSDASAASDGAAPAGVPERPPRGQKAIEAWLAQGHYRTAPWRCEQGISPARGNGAHGRTRVCSNDLVFVGDSGPFPAGAASVKEMYDADDRSNGYAVGLKIAPGDGDATWYWYERGGTSPTSQPVADGVGVEECGPRCHKAAPRDNVYVRAPP